MLGKSASVQSLPKRYQQSTEIISNYPAPLGLSQYQKRMKKFYDDLNERAYENTKKDREVVDHLNDWRYCDPDHRVDELPQPYQGINEIIQDDIMNQVWVNISKVELARKDPSYDNNLPKLQPSGEVTSSQIKGICAIAEAQDNLKKHLFLGDSFGNIFIFDQTKKQVVSKFDQLPDKRRILSMSAQTVKIQGSTIVTLAVVQHGSAHVSILRYIAGGENILLKQFKITTTTPAAALAFNVELSPKATFCALSHYNGNVSVYKIPEPPLKQMDLIDEDDNTNTVHSGTSRFSNKSPMRGSPRSNEYQIPEKKPEEVEELVIHHSIEFKGVKRERKYENVLKDIQKANDTLKASLLGISLEEYLAIENPPPIVEATTAIPAKKDTKKPGKSNEPPKPAEQAVQVVEAIPSILRNAELTQQQYNSQPIIDSVEGDITPAIPLPQYYPRILFQSEKVSTQNKDRLFNKPYITSITSVIFVTWLNTKTIEYHRLVEPIWANVPAFIQFLHTKVIVNAADNKKSEDKINNNSAKNNANPPPPTAPVVVPTANSQFMPKLVSESQMIYPITCVEMSSSEKYLGIGLSDGNMILWDNEFKVQKKVLDAHQAGVTCVRFFYEKMIVSGCKNGEILFHEISGTAATSNESKDEKSTRCQNTYNRRSDNPILGIQVNKYGLVSAIDSLGNARFYNIHLQKKIALLIPSVSYENLSTQVEQKSASAAWSVSPSPLFFASKESDQLYILSEESVANKNGGEHSIGSSEEGKKQQQEKIRILQIFKLDDNLATIYDGIKNLIRNGIPYDQIHFKFTQMTQEQLVDRNFQIESALQQSPQGEVLHTLQSNHSKKNSVVGGVNFTSNNDLSFSLSRGENRDHKGARGIPGLKLDGTSNMATSKHSLRLSNIPKKSLLPSLNSIRDSLFGSPNNHPMSTTLRNQKNNNNNGLTDMKLHPEKYMWKQQYPNSEFYDPVGSSLEMARERASNMHLLENRLSKSMVFLEKSLQHKEQDRLNFLEAERKKQLAADFTKSKIANKSKKHKI